MSYKNIINSLSLLFIANFFHWWLLPISDAGCNNS